MFCEGGWTSGICHENTYSGQSTFNLKVVTGKPLWLRGPLVKKKVKYKNKMEKYE